MVVAKSIKVVMLILICMSLSSCITMPSSCCSTCTDDDITTAVLNAIHRDRCLSYQYIDVRTFENVVTLKGGVYNTIQRAAAEDIARSVSCVRHVENLLVIKNIYNRP